MAAADGVRSSTGRHRDRTVIMTSSIAGAHSIHTVCEAGSSSDLSSALAA